MTKKREIRLSCVMSDDGGFAIYDADDYTNYSRPLSVCHPTGPAADWLRECMTSQERRKNEKAGAPTPTAEPEPEPEAKAETPSILSPDSDSDYITKDQTTLQRQSDALNKAWLDL